MKLKATIYISLLFVCAIGIAIWSTNSHHTLSDTEQPGFDKPNGYFEYFRGIAIPIEKKTSGYLPNYSIREYNKLKQTQPRLKSANSLNWVQRGPGNVGGRTRSIIIDPADATGKTWFAGSVSGGIWKTSDGGNSWVNKTPALPNLSTVSLCMAPSNTNVIFAGTGEGYGGEGMVTGSGLFLSKDRGETWDSVAFTFSKQEFRYINDIWVSDYSDSVLCIATNEGVYRSVNQGASFEVVFQNGYPVQDLVANPLNNNVIYGGVNTFGVIRSNNGGLSWSKASQGMAEAYRISLDVSSVDTAVVFASAEAPGAQTHVYYSENGARSWTLHYDSDGNFINFHRSQGWFNNVIKAHPFEKRKAFIGGVYVGELEFKRQTYTGTASIMGVDTINTGSYLNFINFGGANFRGALANGISEEAEVENDDFVSVEIRFGAGKSQKAHRFTVPEGEGAGVPAKDYTYTNYVNVPFEVWDIEENRQLMVSFRDQERDGVYNLIERDIDDDVSGREYLFVSAYTYNESQPQVEITEEGYEQKLLYFLWPSLVEDAVWNPDNMPDSRIRIRYGSIEYREVETNVLADERKNDSLHVDHHDMKIFVTDSVNKIFRIVDANDGGLGVSEDNGANWKQLNKGYLTTQFYGVAKRPGKQEYIGGMQDNGTWQSPGKSSASKTSNYEFRLSGDGFEALWHPLYPHRILASSYNNYIFITNDEGENWNLTTDGINGDGPFITKLRHSKENPNLVFAVGSRGLYKHTNFGLGKYPWISVNLGDSWAIDNSVTSMHQVEVSLASPDIVWAGAGMFRDPDLNIFVSKDKGETFDIVNMYTEDTLGYVSGMATHPTNEGGAFLLFSRHGKAKILRTNNFGNTWEDITQFGDDSLSHNGFPDVIVHDLLVMPHDTNNIWVATEIGLIESKDNGVSWQYSAEDLPSVSIWQLDIADDNIIAATHGRGIWTASLGLVGEEPLTERQGDLMVYPNPARDIVSLKAPSFGNTEVRAIIYNINGTILYNKVYQGKNSDFTTQIDVLGYLPGTYFVRMESSEKQLVKKLIIVD